MIIMVPVELRGIMSTKEDFKEFVECDKSRVEGDLNNFSMASLPSFDLLVGGILEFTTRISWDSSNDSFDPGKDCFDAPKATSSESGNFGVNLGGY